MAYLNTIQSHNDDLRYILADVNALPDAGGSAPVLQRKTVTPSTDTQVVEPDDGYDGLASVEVEAMPIATQATPSIIVGTGGKITATVTQDAGYVSGGTKSATQQLLTQGAQIITPGTTNITIPAGNYLTGTQTIKGSANLLPENIVSGVTIFGVAGTAEVGGGEDTSDVFAQFIEGNMTDLYSTATSVVDNRFWNDLTLETVNLPNARWVNDGAFSGCENLKLADFKALESIVGNAFVSTNLQALVIRNTSLVVTLAGTGSFNNTPIANGNGYIYVPRSLLDSYSNDDGWHIYGGQILAIEDYTVDGTVDGELNIEFSTTMDYTVFTWDIAASAPAMILHEFSAPAGMVWGEFIGGEYNQGEWIPTDAGYVTFNDLYYVYDPAEDRLVTMYDLIDPYDAGMIAVITADEAQGYM